MLFKHYYQITYYSNDQTLTSSNIFPRNLSTQCIVYLQSLQPCNFESWFCIKGSNTDPTHLFWLLPTESGPHFSKESQNQAFEIMITISYDNLCFYNRFPVCFVCQVCLSRYGLFIFFGTFVFSFALWYSRFHGMESTFSLPYIAWVSCGNGWVHQVCTKWTGVTALCFRLGGEGLGREYQLANFQFSDENNPGLHSLCDWSRKRAPFSQPIGCKPKTDHDLIFRVFPHSRHYGWVIVVFQCLFWLL